MGSVVKFPTDEKPTDSEAMLRAKWMWRMGNIDIVNLLNMEEALEAGDEMTLGFFVRDGVKEIVKP